MFDFVSTFEDTGERKPSPVPFKRALEYFDVAPEESIMVGDWPERDLTGAAKVGMITVFARYGNTFGTVDSGAQYDINDIVELIDIVDNLNGANKK
jgi:putative hydrolase of the HAD superfamily